MGQLTVGEADVVSIFSGRVAMRRCDAADYSAALCAAHERGEAIGLALTA